MKITQVYIPHIQGSLSLRRSIRDLEIPEEKKDFAQHPSEEKIVPLGLMDGCVQNQQYKNILISSGVCGKGNSEIVEKLRVWSGEDRFCERRYSPSTYPYKAITDTVETQQKEAIVGMKKKGWRFPTIASTCEIPEQVIRHVINEEKFNKKQKNIARKREKLKFRVTEVHVEEASRYLEEANLSKITIDQLKTHLNEQLPERRLSRAGVYYLLKCRLGFSYKKATKVPPKMFTSDRIRHVCEAAYLQAYLEAQGLTLIYVDEFHMNLRTSSLYNWSPKGSPCILEMATDSCKLSFSIAFSSRRIEGVIGADCSITSKAFIMLIEGMRSKIEDETTDTI